MLYTLDQIIEALKRKPNWNINEIIEELKQYKPKNKIKDISDEPKTNISDAYSWINWFRYRSGIKDLITAKKIFDLRNSGNLSDDKLKEFITKESI